MTAIKMNGESRSSVSVEARRILMDCLLNNTDLAIPTVVSEPASTVVFTPDVKPFMPTPMKMTESVSAMWGCIGLFANTICRERYHLPGPETIEVDVYSATLMLSSLALYEVNGHGFADGDLMARAAHLDKGHISETYRSLATNM